MQFFWFHIQTEVFGHILEQGEFEALPDAEKSPKRDKFQSAVLKRVENRFKERIKPPPAAPSPADEGARS